MRPLKNTSHDSIRQQISDEAIRNEKSLNHMMVAFVGFVLVVCLCVFVLASVVFALSLLCV